MGSKLRKLRVQAGVSGENYQREQRLQRYRKDREARALLAQLSSCVGCGSALQDPRTQLCPECSSRVGGTMVRPVPAGQTVEFADGNRLTFTGPTDTYGGPVLGVHDEPLQLEPFLPVPRSIETRPDGSVVASFNSPGGQLAAEPVLVVGPEPRRPPASAMRLSRLQSVMAVSMLLAGLPGKEEP